MAHLQSCGGHEALDLGRLDKLLAVLGLGVAANDESTHVVGLGQAKQLAQTVGTLGAEAAGLLLIGEASNVLLALLDDDEVDNGHFRRDNAPARGLALALALATGAVARHAWARERVEK